VYDAGLEIRTLDLYNIRSSVTSPRNSKSYHNPPHRSHTILFHAAMSFPPTLRQPYLLETATNPSLPTLPLTPRAQHSQPSFPIPHHDIIIVLPSPPPITYIKHHHPTSSAQPSTRRYSKHPFKDLHMFRKPTRSTLPLYLERGGSQPTTIHRGR
jgi:hypothetical protein